MRALKIKNTVLGEGLTKIIASVTESTALMASEEVRRAISYGADIIEWRADTLNGYSEICGLIDTLRLIKNASGNAPLLFTMRTEGQGGKADPNLSNQLIEAAASKNIADIIDVEYTGKKETIKQISKIRQNNPFILLSSHFMKETPDETALLSHLNSMLQLEPDIVKVAAMPQTPRDVLALLSCTEKISHTASVPVITMSMSSIGVMTRLFGGIFGSSAVFGYAGESAAPGQIHVAELRRLIDIYCLRP